MPAALDCCGSKRQLHFSQRGRTHTWRSIVASSNSALYPSLSPGKSCAASTALHNISRTSRPHRLRLQKLEPARASHSTIGHTDNMQSLAWDDLDVAVVGGGPAGLAAAAALLRVQPGLKVKVFEAAPSYNSQPGAGVVINYNGARALEAIDPAMLHKMVEASVLPAALFTYNDKTGERMPYASLLPHAKNLEEKGYTPSVVQWYQIRAALYGCVPPGVVEFGCKVVSVSHSSTASTTDGSGAAGEEGPFVLQLTCSGNPTAAAAAAAGQGQQEQEQQAVVVEARARHVIAADGYFSRVRRTAGNGVTPEFRRRVNWRGSITWSELESGHVPLPRFLDTQDQPLAPLCSHLFVPVGPDGKQAPGPPERTSVFYGVGSGGSNDGSRRDRIVWTVAVPLSVLEEAGLEYPMRTAPEAEAEAEAHQAAGDGGRATSVQLAGATGPEVLRRVVAATAFLPPDVRALVAATPADRVSEHGSCVHTPATMTPGAWVQGGLLLLGDAAHTGPADGQGANLALEDAAELGARVREHGLGPKAFTAWEAARQQRVADILFDTTPLAEVRNRLVNSAAFEPLWDPVALAREGALPGEVAAEVEAAAAAGDSEAAKQAVLAWSKGVVRSLQSAKMPSQEELATLPPPPADTWRFR